MAASTSATRTITDVACTVCGCVCDDLEFDVDQGRIAAVRRACSLAEPWFAALNTADAPAAVVEGQLADSDRAVECAAEILTGSHNPLIFGLSRSSTGGQRAAVALAEQLRANVDTTASVCHGPSIMAIQQVGESTCSLGEIRNRADLVIFWGADPMVSHPRHFERYSVDPAGLFVPGGRADRTVVVVDTKRTTTAEGADLFLQVAPDRDFEMIWALRQLIRGEEPTLPVDAGIAVEELRNLAPRMTECRYGVVFFGLGLAQRGLGHLTVDALLRLVAELNDHTRFTARRLRIPGDVAGADCVLCWQTGFPFAVNLAREYPRYGPGEFSADELLRGGDVDACLIVGSESTQLLSPAARDRLGKIPTIVLDYPHVSPSWAATVRLTTAVYGVHAPGVAYRMDEVPIPLRPVLPSDHPTDEAVLQSISQACRRRE